jgi:lipopolysaccharide transport system ATP-binding protein
MSMSFMIRVDNLGKRYRLGSVHRSSIREVVNRAWKRLLGKRDGLLPHERAEMEAYIGRQAEADGSFWALRDVSFEVQPGEVVGIIGPNGSGKSTLLKLLSQITAPTQGRVELHGRVASLLEVGTGFHPELSGRENVYLNGAILGMTKAEIHRKFDQIVAFAEIEPFIDTPVKRYSSGMYVRLAFAVAAHLEPEILVVDEVLAVGDADFQHKCIGAMKEVGRGGRTVLVVSHNLATIDSLCRRSLLLDRGEVRSCGPSNEVIRDFLRNIGKEGPAETLDDPHRNPGTGARLVGCSLLDAQLHPCTNFKVGDTMSVQLQILAERPILRPWIGIEIRTALNQLLYHVANRECGCELPALSGPSRVTCRFESVNLLPGRYSVDLVLADASQKRYDHVPQAAFFDIHPTDVSGIGIPLTSGHGLVYFKSHWQASSAGNIPLDRRKLVTDAI